jgi:hypothetical protein
MKIISKIFKVGIRTVGTAGALGIDLVTTAVALPPKLFTESRDATPFLTENAGRKLIESVKELSNEIDKL